MKKSEYKFNKHRASQINNLSRPNEKLFFGKIITSQFLYQKEKSLKNKAVSHHRLKKTAVKWKK